MPVANASATNNYAENWQKTHGFLSWAGAYAIPYGNILLRITVGDRMLAPSHISSLR